MMTTQRLTLVCQRMAVMTLILLVGMLLLNAACWFFPNLTSAEGGYGFSFGLTNSLIAGLGVDLSVFPWWQLLGGIILSSIPLLVLASGLYYLYLLFQVYGRGEYFSTVSAVHLGKVGRAVALWVVLDFLCEPLLSFWMTMNQGEGQRMITLGLDSSSFVVLFLAGCIVVIARILQQACDIDYENKQFI